MVGVVFETFACSCPATGKIFKDLPPALPVLGQSGIIIETSPLTQP
jgi:hypothetical protein